MHVLQLTMLVAATRALVAPPTSRSRLLRPLQAAAVAERVGKLRLDALLLQRGFAASRSQATALIREGAVTVDERSVVKPGTKVAADASIKVASEKNVRYVSRGGEKLHAAFEAWPEIVPDGRTVLDIGASTGGFSHCALHHGAAAVDAVDVGSGQFHASLLEDDRVRSFENVNCRYDDELAAIPLREAYDLVVTDCSFISLTKLLPAIWRKVDAGGDLMCLVKPQFECGPDVVRKGRGVVRDPADRQAAVDSIIAFAREELSGCEVVDDAVESPVHDKLGNREFLLRLRRRNTGLASLEASVALPAAMPGVAAALAAATPGIAAAADGGNPDQGAIVAYAWFAISAIAGVKGVADKLRNE